MMTPIICGFVGGIFISLLMVGYLVGRRRRKQYLEELKEIRRQRIEIKLKHRAALNEQLQKVFKDIEEYRENLHQTTFRYFDCHEAGDSEGENTCHIRGNIVVEQIESYMEEAERLLDEIQDVDLVLEELENES